MRGFLKYLATVLLCIVFATVVSYFSFFSFYFAAVWFHSVAAVRACDAVGSIVLLPVRIIFRCFGGLFDQSLPLSHPLNYVVTNGIFLGFLIYTCIRPLVFGRKKADDQEKKKP